MSFIKELELLEEGPMEVRFAKLMEREETKREAWKKLEVHQAQMKSSFDEREKFREFVVGDFVLKWDGKKRKLGKHSKFDAFWDGPYVIIECKDWNSFQLSRLTEEILPILVNGIHLKHYF